jgi:hypothetical protein
MYKNFDLHYRIKPINIKLISVLFSTLKLGDQVVDIGCGQNWVKRLPLSNTLNVVGFDPLDPKADYKACITKDDEWCSQHQDYFDAGIALNCLHFATTEGVLDNIDLSLNLLKKRSYLYLSLNQSRIDERDNTTTDDIKLTFDHWVSLLSKYYDIKISYLFKDEGDDASLSGQHHFILRRRYVD